MPAIRIDWRRIVTAAITANAGDYLNPPIANFGPAGIRKTAAMVRTWPDRYAADDIAQIGSLMEHGGTGGGLFRNFYRDFLVEANQYLDAPELDEAAPMFDQAARWWTRIANLFIGTGAGRSRDGAEAADLLGRVADLEEAAMTLLAGLRRY